MSHNYNWSGKLWTHSFRSSSTTHSSLATGTKTSSQMRLCAEIYNKYMCEIYNIHMCEIRTLPKIKLSNHYKITYLHTALFPSWKLNVVLR